MVQERGTLSRFAQGVRQELNTLRADPNVRRALDEAKTRDAAAKTPQEIERAAAVTVLEVGGAVVFHIATRAGRKAVEVYRQRRQQTQQTS